MHARREHFLADARLAEQKDVERALRREIEELMDALHRRIAHDDVARWSPALLRARR
jgi:hypothetical protein